MLVIDDLAKVYDSKNTVGPISITVPSGLKYGLLGPNGSGKSTIIHSITGLLPVEQGQIHIQGMPHDTVEAKQHMGFVPDEAPLPYALTGKNYLDFVLSAQPAGDVYRSEMLKEAVGLHDAEHKFIGEYSHGMKKKLQFVAAMSHAPRVLILDEPFRGLDPAARSLIEALIDEHCLHGGVALIATHDLRWAEVGVDEACILKDGSVAAVGPINELIQQSAASSLEEVFLNVSGVGNAQRHQRQLISELFAEG